VSIPPLVYQWNGEAMEPLPRFHNLANSQLCIGQTYRLVEEEERSEVSHRHEFAWLREAWQNLPEAISDDFPTSEHLRKRALIATGFYNEQIIDAGSQAAALRVAIGVRAIPGEDFSHIVTRGGLVVIRRAKSQKRSQMGAADFQASKTAILEWVANLLSITPEQLSQQGQGARGANNLARVAA
jgi:hypothetical protein